MDNRITLMFNSNYSVAVHIMFGNGCEWKQYAKLTPSGATGNPI